MPGLNLGQPSSRASTLHVRLLFQPLKKNSWYWILFTIIQQQKGLLILSIGFWATPKGDQGLSLPLHSGITPGRIHGTFWGPGIESVWVAQKASSLLLYYLSKRDTYIPRRPGLPFIPAMVRSFALSSVILIAVPEAQTNKQLKIVYIFLAQGEAQRLSTCFI